MKVLLLGDASNYHHTLAGGLAALGHDVTVASDGSRWMDTQRDIDLSRRPGKLGGAMLWLKLNTLFAYDLKGYDVVQLVSPSFVQLRPQRLIRLFRHLKRDNGAVYLTALGTDSHLVRNLLGPKPALAYSEWHDSRGPSAWSTIAAAERDKWLAPELADYTDEFYAGLDGAVTALYEYHRITAAETSDLPLAYGGIPVEIPESDLRKRDFARPLTVMLAAHRGREAEKGADILADLFKRLDSALPGRLQLWQPENVAYAQFTGLLDRADIVVDQLYSYTPATTALLAMARGAVIVSGGEEDYYDFIGEPSLRPILNPDPRDIDATYNNIYRALTDAEALARMSAEGPEFVRRHNSPVTVARRFEQFWLQ